jgi:hypothetical protein
MMNLMKNLTLTMSALAFMAFSFTSCSDELVESGGVKNEVATVTVPVNISSTLGTSSASTRAGIGMSENSDGKFQYNFDSLYVQQGDTGAFDFVIASIYGSNTSYQILEDVPIKVSNGTYYISMSVDDLEIPAAAENDLNNLEVCGLLVPNGTGSTFKNAFDGQTQSDMGTLVMADGNFFVPLYSSTDTTLVTVNGDGSAANSTLSIAMNFSMMGTVITAKFKTNPLANNVYVDSVRMRYSNVKSGVITWKMGDEDANGHPNFTFQGNGESDNFKLSFSEPLLVKSNLFKNSGEVFKARAWVMPVDSTDFTTDYDIYYHLKGDVDYSSAVVNYPQSGTEKTYENGFKYGTVNTIALGMPESDLMITEFEHYNPGLGKSNWAMIELYNPTDTIIDLSNYGLVRCTEYYSSDEWKGYDTNTGSYDSGHSAATSDLSLARVQDIYIDASSSSQFTSSSGADKGFQGPYNCKTLDGADVGTGFSNTFALFDGEHISDLHTYPSTQSYTYTIGDDTNSVTVTLKPNELGPGQTVIVAAAASEYYAANGSAYNYNGWHSSSNYFGCNYLDNAAAKGKLRYAVAVDNGGNSYHNVAGSNNQSGVMQHTNSTVMQLVKLSADTIIDMPGYFKETYSKEIYYNYIAKSTSSSTSEADYFVFSRNPSAMYPMYLIDSRYYTDHSSSQEELYAYLQTLTAVNGTAWKMFDWVWCYPTNYFNITAPSTTSDYESMYYSPGTKGFELDVYNGN